MSTLVDAVPADMGSGSHYSADLRTVEEILGCWVFLKQAFAMD